MRGNLGHIIMLFLAIKFAIKTIDRSIDGDIGLPYILYATLTLPLLIWYWHDAAKP